MSVSLHPQFLVDENGERRSVLLSIEEYQALLEEVYEEEVLDEQDARELRHLMDTSNPEDFVPLEEVQAELRALGKIK